MSGLVYIISAPSGSGKSTLVNEIRREVAALDFSVSYTTREPRGSEQDGLQYRFIDKPAFEQMIAEDAFLEHALVHDHYYGTARHFLTDACEHHHDLLLDIDVQGAEQVQQKLPEAISIFLLPPSRQELERRLRRRSEQEHVAGEVIDRRLAAAGREIEKYEKYDYILVNDHLEEAIEALKAIVLGERVLNEGRALTDEEKGWVELAKQHRMEAMRSGIQKILASFGKQS
jgi:guanylate kinase